MKKIIWIIPIVFSILITIWFAAYLLELRDQGVGPYAIEGDVARVLTSEEEPEIFFDKFSETVSSPLEISGRARGYWLFEGSAPVRLESLSGDLIAESYIEAGGEWMTEDYVSFSGIVEFETDESEVVLRVMKANPSGLPEQDKEFAIILKTK